MRCRWLWLAMLCALPLLAHGQPTGKLWLIYIDDLHIDFVNTGHLRQLLETMTSELFQPGDEFMAWTSGPSRPWVERTSDPSRLSAAKRSVSGNGLKPTDIVGPAGFDEMRFRMRTSLATACDAIKAVRTIPLRKGLVYVSNGYFQAARADTAACDELPEVVHAAREADVRIFALDARILNGVPAPDPRMAADAWHAYWTDTQASLRYLSEGSGGFAFLDSQDLVGALRNIRRALP